jgi:hypothetical protein
MNMGKKANKRVAQVLKMLLISSVLASNLAFAEAPCEPFRCKTNPCDVEPECPMHYTFHEQCCECLWTDWTAFVGVDYEWNAINKSGPWKHLLPSSEPGVNMFVGGRVLQYFGAELGYEALIKRSKVHTHAIGDRAFDTIITAATAGRTKHKVGIFGWHIDLKGYFPLNSYCVVPACLGGCLDLVGTIGYGVVEPKVHFSSTAPLFNRQAQVTLHGKRSGVWRLGAGAELMFNNLIGLRSMVRWKDLSRLRVRNHDRFLSLAIGDHQKVFRRSLSFSLGLFATN